MALSPDSNAVLEAFYEASVQPSLWPSALARLGDRFGGAASIVGLLPAPDSALFLATARLDEARSSLYLTRYAKPARNPTLERLGSAPVGEPISIAGSVAERLRASELNAEVLAPQGLWPLAKAVVLREDGIQAPFGLYGPSHREPLFDGEVAELRLMLRHLGRALGVTLHLIQAETARSDLHSALDATSSPMIIVDAAARILWASADARRLLADHDGLSGRGDRLRASDPAAHTHLLQRIARACDAEELGGGLFRVVRPSGRSALALKIAPLHASVDGRGVGLRHRKALVLLRDPEAVPTGAEDYLRVVHGLTEAEARAVACLSRGGTTTEAAKALGVSPNTLKTLLQRAISKTGMRGRVELANLVAGAVSDLSLRQGRPPDRTGLGEAAAGGPAPRAMRIRSSRSD